MERRYHGLDALRAGAMLLGVVLHACQFYQTPGWMPGIVPWVSETPPKASASTAMLAIWIHLWRMPVFFVLSGFFAQMMLERRGTWPFWQDRFVRIFLTLLVFHALVVLVVGRPLGILAHLWFLWLLSFFCLLAPLTSRGVTLLLPGHDSGSWGRAALIAGTILLLTTTVGLLGRNNLWHEIPGRFNDPEWRGFVLYGFFFVLGQVFWKWRAAIGVLSRRRVFVPLLLVASIAWLELGRLYFAPIPEALRQGMVAVATLGFGFGLIGLAERVIRRPYRWVRRGVEMSYAVYLFHLYIVFNLSGLTIQWGWDQHLSILAVTVAGTGLSICCWLVFVRYTPLDWLLAGRHKSWWQWPFARNGTNKKGRSPERPS